MNFSTDCTKLKANKIAKLHSGANKHYFKMEHKHLLQKQNKSKNGPMAILPNNKKVHESDNRLDKLHPSLSK